jgi:hypothetical protein
MFYITTPPYGHSFSTTPPFGHPSKGGEFSPLRHGVLEMGRMTYAGAAGVEALTGFRGHRHIPGYRYGSPNGLGRNGVLLRFYSANLFVRFLLRLNFFSLQVVDTQCVDCVLGSCYTTTNLTAFPPLYLCRRNSFGRFQRSLTCCSVFAIFYEQVFSSFFLMKTLLSIIHYQLSIFN